MTQNRYLLATLYESKGSKLVATGTAFNEDGEEPRVLSLSFRLRFIMSSQYFDVTRGFVSTALQYMQCILVHYPNLNH